MFSINIITTNDLNESIFGVKEFDSETRGGMLLTKRIDAKNFRLRESDAGYKTDWHLAGDATLIIVQSGILRIILQNGDFKNFKSGDMFIADDNLPKGVIFDSTIHGHRAEVVGDDKMCAIHIKL